LSGVHPRLEQLCDEAYAAADTIRRAVTAAFLDLAITVQQHDAGHSRKALEAGCGSSAAVAVRTGRLLTVANCGTTKAVLDLGSCAYECTSDHRIGDNEAEDDRLTAGESPKSAAATCTQQPSQHHAKAAGSPHAA
jgi:serine/threonine protein phosphatase PrpC